MPRRKFGWPDCLDGRHAAETRDGSIVIAGVLGCGGEAGGPMSTFVARLLADGSLDRSFANRGVRVTGDCASAGVAEWRDGKIVHRHGHRHRRILLRRRHEGRPAHARRSARPPASAGTAASTSVPRRGRQPPVRVSAIDGRRRIIVAGAAGRHVGVARITPAGRLDRSFGDDGLAIRRLRRRSYATCVAVAANGAVTSPPQRRTRRSSGLPLAFIVLRFAADGDPDPAFGSPWPAKLPFGPTSPKRTT